MPQYGTYTAVDVVAADDESVLTDTSDGGKTKRFTFAQVRTYLEGALTLAANRITSGVLAMARGGLNADVSGFSGILKIVAGAASAVAAPSGTIVGHTDSIALTNKSIDADNNTLTNIANAAIKANAAIAYSKLNLALSVLNGDIATNAAIDGGKITPNFGAQKISTTGAIDVGTGTLPTGTDGINLGANAKIKARGTAAEYNALGIASGEILRLGETAQHVQVGLGSNNDGRIQVGGEWIYQVGTSQAHRWFTGSTERGRFTSSAFAFGLPISGFATGSVPLRFLRTAITITGNTTLTAAQYENGFIDLNGTPAGAFDVILPDSAGATVFFKNNSGQTATIKKSGGTGFTLANGATACAHHNGTDYESRAT